jgi:hypothetical protein
VAYAIPRDPTNNNNDNLGHENYREVVVAISWAVNNGIRIISMSLGYSTDYSQLRQAVDNAYAAGALLIAAAGFYTMKYPAKYSSVIAVGAVYSDGTRPSWSPTGSELELVAPGVDINSTWVGGGYGVDSGTSMAAPPCDCYGCLDLVV